MMKRISSIRQAIACVLLIVSAVLSSFSQTNSGKTRSASISGKITIKNKAVAGIVVFAHEQSTPGAEIYRGTTDQTGSYKITNLPAGTYVVTPVAPSLAVEDELKNNSIVVSEGETVEGVDFSMVQGGVITGRVTDAEGKPLIEEYVTLVRIDSAAIYERHDGGIRTDDRGIYRAFGLRQGKYRVSVGRENGYPRGSRRSYRKTFYPSVTNAEKATLIEVKEGNETKDVDIVVGHPLPTFQISGRIVDGETGKPLPNIKYGLHQQIDDGSSQSTVGRVFTNANGEFSLENVAPGKYVVFIVPEQSGFRGDSFSFEVVDRDIADLLIKAVRAASLSGVVVLDGPEQTSPPVTLRDLHINAWVESNEAQMDSPYDVPVNPDGSFKLSGLRKGLTHFHFSSNSNVAKHIALVRVERDGIAQPQGIILKDGEQVTGLRLVVKYLTGAIHGQVKVEGDELPPNSRMSIWISTIGDDRSGFQLTPEGPSPQLDSRRRFVIEGLAAGTYEINVAVFDPKRHDTSKVFKQQVTVADNAVSEVTVVIKSKP